MNTYTKKCKVFAISILFMMFFNFFYSNNIFAAINTTYGDNAQESIDLDEDEVVGSSPITNYIGSFIYTIGVLVERLTSNIVFLLTGDKTFPWADRVIFNTIPLLDVNFINPDEKSLLNTSNGIGNVVRNIYFTGLSLALGFLGIIVAVMAIKLVISTIASEKAKYKEAIVKWLTAIILLFGMHFVLSFLFYINEQLVIMASNVLKNEINNNYKKLEDVVDNTLNSDKKRIVLNFCNKAVRSAAWAEAYSLMTPFGWISNGIQWIAGTISGDSENAQMVAVAQENAQNLMNNYEITYMLISNKAVREYALDYVEGNSENNWLENMLSSVTGSISGIFGYSPASDELAWMNWAVNYIKGGIDEVTYNEQIQQINYVQDNNDKDTSEYRAAELLKVVNTYAYQYAKNGTLEDSDIENNRFQLIGQLGDYFKTTAWYTDIESGGWSPSSVSIVSATLYTVFVFQSLMFFIAYIKRFFYVVVLSVIAPFVIIYDFFTKSATL